MVGIMFLYGVWAAIALLSLRGGRDDAEGGLAATPA